MRIVDGDLLALAEEGHFDVVVQGCNTKKRMASGIAKQIATSYPTAEHADNNFYLPSSRRLGTYSSASIPRANGRGFFTIVNAYTQAKPTGQHDGVYVSYDAIRDVFALIGENFRGLRIAYPRIGAGLGGGDWSLIQSIIDDELDGGDHTLVNFVPQGA